MVMLNHRGTKTLFLWIFFKGVGGQMGVEVKYSHILKCKCYVCIGFCFFEGVGD
jgi:hypothetical protein